MCVSKCASTCASTCVSMLLRAHALAPSEVTVLVPAIPACSTFAGPIHQDGTVTIRPCFAHTPLVPRRGGFHELPLRRPCDIRERQLPRDNPQERAPKGKPQIEKPRTHPSPNSPHVLAAHTLPMLIAAVGTPRSRRSSRYRTPHTAGPNPAHLRLPTAHPAPHTPHADTQPLRRVLLHIPTSSASATRAPASGVDRDRCHRHPATAGAGVAEHEIACSCPHRFGDDAPQLHGELARRTCTAHSRGAALDTFHHQPNLQTLPDRKGTG